MRWPRQRATACVVLAATGLPWLSILAVALHLDAHAHHHEPAAEVVAAALHGHHHHAGTPDHDHLLTLSPLAPLPTRHVLEPLPAAIISEASEAARVRVGAAAVVSGLGHDPPHGAHSVTILRI